MAFIDIVDPIQREETVKDYIKNIKEIRARRENSKVRGISQQQDLAKVFQPVVQATQKSTSQITGELKNLKDSHVLQPGPMLELALRVPPAETWLAVCRWLKIVRSTLL